MKRPSPFAVGARWRTAPDPQKSVGHHSFDFVVIGPPKYREPHKAKRFRLEYVDHLEGRCSPTCAQGLEQDYTHKHVKKYATPRGPK